MNTFRGASLSPPIVTPSTNNALRSIDALPATIEMALEQIERSTGMKAVILIGGPAPAAGGEINTHLYVPSSFVYMDH